ncbi:MAG: esterase [Parvicella sp.]
MANFIIQNKLGKVSVLGHSMGGKAAMQFALTNPALLENLIVADIAPVSYADREHAGLIQSMQGLSLENITSRKAADLALSDTVSHPGVRAFLLQNLVFNDADNLWQWRLNLAVLLSYLANIMAFPRVESPCSAPSLFVYGKSSNYVTEENKTVIAKHFPASHLAEIENAGHWLHAEQPTAFYSTCTDFLAKST